MNKKNLVLASALMMSIVGAGCTDAQAKLKDSSTVLLSVGNQSITKGDLYSLMNASAGASLAIDEANKVICNEEIEVTDEMKENAQSTLDSYKSMYGETFTSYLEQNNMTEDDYLNDYLIPSLQAEQLTSHYIEENWNNVIAFYNPIKAIVLEFTDADEASAALSELKDGSATAAEAANNHNSSSTGEEIIYTIESDDLDSIVRTVITSNTPDDGWTQVPSSSGGSYFVVKVVDNDPDNFKDEIIEELDAIDQVSNDATTYYFKKYNFVIYDKTIYDGVATNYPNNLVQNMVDDDTTDTSNTADSTN